MKIPKQAYTLEFKEQDFVGPLAVPVSRAVAHCRVIGLMESFP